MSTITISTDKYEELVRKAYLLDIITEMAEQDGNTYYASDRLTELIKTSKKVNIVASAKIIFAPQTDIDQKTIPVEPF